MGGAAPPPRSLKEADTSHAHSHAASLISPTQPAAPAKPATSLVAKAATAVAAAAVAFTFATGAATAVDQAALKKVVCARTPTAKICLRGSANE